MYYRSPNNPRRQIKIVVTGGLGDQLLATPFIRHFAQCGDYTRISCAVTTDAAQIFDRNPHIHHLISCSGRDLLIWALPEQDCDVFTPYMQVDDPDTTGATLEMVHATNIFSPNQTDRSMVRQVADHHGIDLKDEKPQIYTAPEDEAWAQRRIESYGPGPRVLLNTASKLPQKDLPRPVAQKIVDLLTNHCMVGQFNGSGEPLKGATAWGPLPAIRQSAALFRWLGSVITVDSFPGHLACAMGTPAVVLFGPSNLRTFGHDGHRNLRFGDCPPCADTHRREDCQHTACMQAVDPERVAHELLEIIDNSPN